MLHSQRTSPSIWQPYNAKAARSEESAAKRVMLGVQRPPLRQAGQRQSACARRRGLKPSPHAGHWTCQHQGHPYHLQPRPPRTSLTPPYRPYHQPTNHDGRAVERVMCSDEAMSRSPIAQAGAHNLTRCARDGQSMKSLRHR
jgi:hypothetical protein